MNLGINLGENNLHHAYLIEGEHEEILPEILKLMKTLGINSTGNPDFCQISTDSFKMEDARNLKSLAIEKGNTSAKKIFIISANNFLLEAQNALLKLFEEPIENTHFFVIVPDVDTFLPTLLSRFYVIRPKKHVDNKEAEKFIEMSLGNRIDFIKELLAEDDEESEIISQNSPRSKALKFLNALEFVLVSKRLFDIQVFDQIFKVREFLRQPGSSTKSLMESVALVIPNI